MNAPFTIPRNELTVCSIERVVSTRRESDATCKNFIIQLREDFGKSQERANSIIMRTEGREIEREQLLEGYYIIVMA